MGTIIDEEGLRACLSDIFRIVCWPLGVIADRSNVDNMAVSWRFYEEVGFYTLFLSMAEQVYTFGSDARRAICRCTKAELLYSSSKRTIRILSILLMHFCANECLRSSVCSRGVGYKRRIVSDGIRVKLNLLLILICEKGAGLN